MLHVYAYLSHIYICTPLCNRATCAIQDPLVEPSLSMPDALNRPIVGYALKPSTIGHSDPGPLTPS